MELKLDSEAVHAMLKASVLAQLTPEMQQQLISNAVEHLLKEKVHKGWDAPTNLQQIFNDAVRMKASDLMAAELEKPEVVAEFHKVVSEAVVKALSPNAKAREEIVSNMANALRKVLTGERY